MKTTLPLLALVCLQGCTWLQDHRSINPALPGEPLPPQFSLVSWNVAHGIWTDRREGTSRDLKRLLGNHDLCCIQEFVPSLAPAASGEFARSFRWWCKSEPTGVATFSRTQPVPGSAKALASPGKEFWLTTPKMSLITRYQLGDAQLLVANLHGMNFQPVFNCKLAAQLKRVAKIVSAHEGPAIVCGDFNTWRRDRLKLVQSMFSEFTPVPFSPYTRTGGLRLSRLFLGNPKLPLDHIFVRGLEVIESRVLPLESSDHRALRVVLRYRGPPTND